MLSDPCGLATSRSQFGNVFWTALLVICGEGTIEMLTYLSDEHLLFSVLGSFGATCVLLFAVPHVGLAQPRNVLLGQFVSASLAVATVSLLELCGLDPSEGSSHRHFIAPLALAAAIVGMQLTGCVHPPGGGTALIVAHNWGKFGSSAIAIVLIVNQILWLWTFANNFPAYVWGYEQRKYPRTWNLPKKAQPPVPPPLPHPSGWTSSANSPGSSFVNELEALLVKYEAGGCASAVVPHSRTARAAPALMDQSHRAVATLKPKE